MSTIQSAGMETFVNRYCEDLDGFLLAYPDDTTYCVEYDELFQFDPDLADTLAERPETILADIEEAIRHTATIDKELSDLRVSISGVDPTRITELRSDDLGSFVSVEGRVNAASTVTPQLLVGRFECLTCGGEMEVVQRGKQAGTPDRCHHCERNTQIDLVDGDYRDAQELTLGSMAAEGVTSTELTCIVTDDQVDIAQPGDVVRLNGVYTVDTERLQSRDGSRLVTTDIDVRHIERKTTSFDSFDTERVDEIRALSERDDIYDAVTDSIAPSIYGHDDIKLALALQLFGGVRRTVPSGIDRPGDINILLVGDPGTGKSALIKTASKLAPKSVFASGKGATAAGLTATAQQTTGGEWQLEAGALVLANGGLAAIDEFDKMEDSARKSMHEALEGQQIPINKAGINTVLPAECAVLAGANPVAERWDRYEPLNEQLNLGPALITRFDLIFSLTDTPDAERDRAIADAMLTHDGDDHEPTIDTDLLREYIAYARQEVSPQWTEGARERAKDYFVTLRQQSEETSPISPRVNNDIRKLSEASARVRLSETVCKSDVERAIALKDEHIEHVGLDSDGNVSGSQLDGGRVTQDDRIHIVRTVIGELGDAKREDIIERCAAKGVGERQTVETIDHLRKDGSIYEPERGLYRLA